jgi:methionine aminopeptidase
VGRHPGGEARRRLNEVGRSIEAFAQKNGYSLVRNLASHGVGRSLHDDPREIPTWYEPRDRRVIPEGLVFTIEPFLSLGADWVEELDDGWTLRPPQRQATVQYEHTLVATRAAAGPDAGLGLRSAPSVSSRIRADPPPPQAGEEKSAYPPHP